MAIAELKVRQDAASEAIEKLDQRVTRHDEIISELRTAIAQVATKEDVAALRSDINTAFYQQLKDAHNSIPAKIGLLIAAAGVVVPIVAMVIAHHA
ncbi:hypothetical protein C7410_115169 [Paraburkholderia silvatlantica]|uniref:Uncharacterized protein n=1 Tax=Paraburkholderia silvatlantica TaxID=321895 RepID=A0A2V4UKP1_9BURK|nr:hypothetical protein [Paraburkholderia silvatlantica]PYE21326.1 hypothetical protein C7410_115169 [Paraburkholderia silvatlantica]